jgi:hypothetical protein
MRRKGELPSFAIETAKGGAFAVLEPEALSRTAPGLQRQRLRQSGCIEKGDRAQAEHHAAIWTLIPCGALMAVCMAAPNSANE